MINREDILRDLANRTLALMEQVHQGELVDENLLVELNTLTEFCYEKQKNGLRVSDDEITAMTTIINLLEMRTTLYFGKD